MISNCGHDENGKYTGGKAGDQTGGEYAVINWYNRPWACVLRYPDINVGLKIAEISKDAALNDNVGYDQGQRLTYYNCLREVNWDSAKIITACESDCSASTSANIIAAGNLLGISKLKSISPSNTTSTLRKALVAAGFDLLTDSKYLTSDKYLLPGDILLYDGHHVAVDLDYGSCVKAQPEYTVGWNHDENGWWYADSKTTYYKSCFKTIEDHKYYFGSDGYAYQSKWLQSGDDWYYFDENCYMICNGWAEIGGKWYWFNAAGIMVTNTWYQYNSAWYFLGPDGTMCKSQLVENSGKIYAVDADGKMITEPVTLAPDHDGALQYPGLA